MADQTNVNVAGVDNSVLRQITEAQTTGMKDIGTQMDRIAKSLEALEKKLPKAIAQAIKETSQMGASGVSPHASRSGSQASTSTSGPEPLVANQGQWRGGRSPDPSMTNQEFHRIGGFSRNTSKEAAAEAGFIDAEGEGDIKAYRQHMQEQAAAAAKQYGNTTPPTRLEKAWYGRPSANASFSRSSSRPGADFWQTPMSSGRFMPRFGDENYSLQDYGNLAGDILSGAGSKLADKAPVASANAIVAGEMLHTASNKYLPAADMANRISKPFFKRRADRTDYGTLAGGNPETGDIDGPLGFGVRTKSVLTNEATRRGAALQLRAAFDARGAGLNTTQTSNIIGGVVGMGYKPSSAMGTFTDSSQQFNKLVAAQEKLYKRDPNLISEGETQWLDQAVRFGGGDEIKKAAEAMLNLADVSNKASVSIPQMQQAVFAYTQTLASTGAANPAISAANTISDFTAATGLPPQSFTKFENNGLVKANAMVSTGLAPWQLGLMSPSQKIANQNKTLQDIMQMTPVGSDTKEINPYTGKEQITATGKQKQLATASLYTGMSVPEIQKRLKSAKEMEITSRVSQGFGIDQEGNISNNDKGGYIQGGGTEAWGKMKKDLEKKDSGFSKDEIEQIEDAGKTGGFLGIGESDSGESEEGRNAQAKKYKEIMAEHQKKKSDADENSKQDKIMFDLTDSAKKILKTASDNNKSSANGGGQPIVQAALDQIPGGSILADLLG